MGAFNAQFDGEKSDHVEPSAISRQENESVISRRPSVFGRAT